VCWIQVAQDSVHWWVFMNILVIERNIGAESDGGMFDQLSDMALLRQNSFL